LLKDSYVQIYLMCSHTAVRHWPQTTGDGARYHWKSQYTYVIQHILTDGMANGGMLISIVFFYHSIHTGRLHLKSSYVHNITSTNLH